MMAVRTAGQLIAIGLLVPMLNGAQPAAPEPVKLTQHGNQIDISIGGRPFTTYHFDPAQAKPYLQPLRAATGTVVSRGFPVGNDVPEAHVKDRSLEPHQRDLYFAHGDINGVNFWAEEAFGRFYGQQQSMPYGRTTFRKLDSVKSGSESGSARAEFALEGAGKGVMGTEIQEYTFSGDRTTRRIDCVFTIRADHGPVTINDTKEGTFAIRVAPELNSPPGVMVNSRGGTGEPQIWGKQAEWVDYSGTIGTEQVGIAIFDNPRNFRHPTTWHARGYGLFSVNPFGLRAFTSDPKADGSHRIEPGGSLTLRYRVFIHAGDAKQANVADEYRRYAGRSDPPPPGVESGFSRTTEAGPSRPPRVESGFSRTQTPPQAGHHIFAPLIAAADPLTCDVSNYKPTAGLEALARADQLTVTWRGQGEVELRMRYAIEQRQPIVRELAIRRPGGSWTPLGENLKAEYEVTSGVRRMSEQQAAPLRGLGVELTDDVIDRNRWFAFWDAPLQVPGMREGQRTPRNIGLPRKSEEIRRAHASFDTASCTVRTDGGRLEVEFPGLSMGIFSGSLRFTVYRGTNLIRMDAVAATREPWVAYKYEGGLQGFSTGVVPRVAWRDQGGHAQQYRFGGVTNDTRVAVRAANRLLVAEGSRGSIAVFPPPHTFFFTREVETNLGYVWYRKDKDRRFGLGVRQADGEDVAEYSENFALYNAPPGASQRMAVYFYAGAGDAEATRQAALAFTHGDVFKAIPGYKTFVNHFHLRFTQRLRAGGSLDTQTEDLAAMRALGLNIVGLSDFHGDLHPDDPGPLRFKDWKDYAEASRKASDADFLVTPWEEPSAYFGGHYNVIFPKLVYWSKVRKEGQPFKENDSTYGTVYHAGNEADVQQLLDTENGYWFHAHPRTKGTTGFPDAVFDKPWVRNDRYLGVAFKPGMGMDLSERRLCEWRCFDVTDTMNNLFASTSLAPKFIIADVDTYKKGPEDDLYPAFPVNYLHLDKVPGPEDDWTAILKALRDGDFFVTTGEILIPRYRVEGTGNRRTITADVEWTFPLEFVEVVWGDGKTVDRQIIRATDLPPFGTKRFTLPFDATGKVWVRFAVWDSAGNGAFVQPIKLTTR